MGEILLGLGANGERQVLHLGLANRHGLIAGATGTGKTVTLQTIAEQFSAAGVPAARGFCKRGPAPDFCFVAIFRTPGNRFRRTVFPPGSKSL